MVVIGVQNAKFYHEQDYNNVKEACHRLNINHPVIVDEDMQIRRTVVLPAHFDGFDVEHRERTWLSRWVVTLSLITELRHDLHQFLNNAVIVNDVLNFNFLLFQKVIDIIFCGLCSFWVYFFWADQYCDVIFSNVLFP